VSTNRPTLDGPEKELAVYIASLLRRRYFPVVFVASMLVVAACGGSESADEATPTATPTEEARMVQDGDTVSVHYTGTLDNGEQFDSSVGRDPLTFTVGSGQVISGFDDAVRGHAVGESIDVRIPPEEAYGQRDEQQVLDVAKAGAPPDLEVGDKVRLQNGATAVVLDITADTVRIDANHPLAGEALNFTIEIVSIN